MRPIPLRASFSLLIVALAAGIGRADSVVTFDDLPLAPNSYWNGPDPDGTIVAGAYGPVNVGRFTSGGVSFVNRYEMTYGSWGGFAHSNTTDTTTPGYRNQFSAITGSGRDSDAYGLAFGYRDVSPNILNPNPFNPENPAHLSALPTFELPEGQAIGGMYVTNTTYAALSMRDGDGISRRFGGTTGDEPDWFKLTAYGTDASGRPLGTSVEFYLADFRFADGTLDYILTDWAFMDLSPLAGARRLHFNLSSSDVGDYGMNTPAYFAVDDILLRSPVAVPEPSSLALVALGLAGFAAALRGRPA